MKLFKCLLCSIVVSFYSCDYRADKYLRATKNWDGPRCKTFEYLNFESLEIAKCLETGIYLGAPNNNNPEYGNYFTDEVVTIYATEEKDIYVFKRSALIDRIFKDAVKKGKICDIYVDNNSISIKTQYDLYTTKISTYRF